MNNPGQSRQLRCGESLFTIFNCPLNKKMADAWSHYNYIVYVMQGRKVWHTAQGSYDLKEGSCVFVRKGACIMEQFFDSGFCLILFFVPDDFIYNVLTSKSTPLFRSAKQFDPVIPIDSNPAIKAFYQSMISFFEAVREPDPAILELKFRELILTIADNPVNDELLSYFCSLLRKPHNVSLRQVMEDNFCFNLKLEEFAKLSSRSLSAFKRDFERMYHTTPGRWLMEKRLSHTMHLLTNIGKTVSETAFESGFKNTSHFSRAFRQRFGISPASVKLKWAV